MECEICGKPVPENNPIRENRTKAKSLQTQEKETTPETTSQAKSS